LITFEILFDIIYTANIKMNNISIFEKNQLKKYSVKYKKDILFNERTDFVKSVVNTRINKFNEFIVKLMNKYTKYDDKSTLKEYFYNKWVFLYELIYYKYTIRKIDEVQNRPTTGIRGLYKLKPYTIMLDYYSSYFNKTIKNFHNIKVEMFERKNKELCVKCNKLFSPCYIKRHIEKCSNKPKYNHSEKHKCECGVYYISSNKSRHLASMKHLNYRSPNFYKTLNEPTDNLNKTQNEPTDNLNRTLNEPTEGNSVEIK